MASVDAIFHAHHSASRSVCLSALCVLEEASLTEQEGTLGPPFTHSSHLHQTCHSGCIGLQSLISTSQLAFQDSRLAFHFSYRSSSWSVFDDNLLPETPSLHSRRHRSARVAEQRQNHRHVIATCNDALVSQTSNPIHQVGSRRVNSAVAVDDHRVWSANLA